MTAQIRNWWYGSPPADTKSTAFPDVKVSSPVNLPGIGGSTPVKLTTPVQVPATIAPQIPIQQSEQISRAVPDEAVGQVPHDAKALHAQMDIVNDRKMMYDECEKRRMQAVISGKDLQEYSCEREFAAFKQAFDVQTSLERKPTFGSS